MFYHTESKAQGWRALAVFADGGECLLYVGRSTTQVRAGYREAFLELLDDEERARVQRISLQVWDGAPDRGRWVAKTTLSLPAPGGVTAPKARDLPPATALLLERDAQAAPTHPLLLPFPRCTAGPARSVAEKAVVLPFLPPEAGPVDLAVRHEGPLTA